MHGFQNVLQKSEKCAAAITAASLLGNGSPCFVHTEAEIFAPSHLQNSFGSLGKGAVFSATQHFACRPKSLMLVSSEQSTLFPMFHQSLPSWWQTAFRTSYEISSTWLSSCHSSIKARPAKHGNRCLGK
ncbi:hypothetical protein CHARACLAT_033281 [Characodon lateralis]|uniref:Uncharacterized protein n=1 Tax=Characodon lateralis TaxID=208331 RepID=A0ABU7F8I3_9TELE|nr:hypothetical protein [Characodon lateralis]